VLNGNAHDGDAALSARSENNACRSAAQLVAAELREPGNSTTTESNSACNEALMIG
jgi:hypothetical protein